jgi:hypothetical protein
MVSSAGMPFSKALNLRNQVNLLSPNCFMSFQPSAPEMMATTVKKSHQVNHAFY